MAQAIPRLVSLASLLLIPAAARAQEAPPVSVTFALRSSAFEQLYGTKAARQAAEKATAVRLADLLSKRISLWPFKPSVDPGAPLVSAWIEKDNQAWNLMLGVLPKPGQPEADVLPVLLYRTGDIDWQGFPPASRIPVRKRKKGARGREEGRRQEGSAPRGGVAVPLTVHARAADRGRCECVSVWMADECASGGDGVFRRGGDGGCARGGGLRFSRGP